jgi:hypothetical protein
MDANRAFGLKREEEADGGNCIIENLKNCVPY